MLTLALIVPGLIAAYVLLRPILKAIPRFAQFYKEADGFWAKVWALCGNSMTIAWSYAITGLGLAFQWLDTVGQLFGQPDLKEQAMDALKDHPKALAYLAVFITLSTIASRLRSLIKAA